MVLVDASPTATVDLNLFFAWSISDDPSEQSFPIRSLLGFIIPKVLSENDFDAYLGKPLKTIIDNAWLKTALVPGDFDQSILEASLIQAIKGEIDGASNFDFTIPPSGSLSFEVDDHASIEMLKTLGPIDTDVTAQQLNIRYFVPGIKVNFFAPVTGWALVLSLIFSPLTTLGLSVDLTLDVEILAYVAVPSKTNVPWAGKMFNQAQNLQVSGGGGNFITRAWNGFWLLVSGNSGSMPDQDPKGGLISQDDLKDLTTLLQSVYNDGFTDITMKLEEDQGAILGVDLTHPFDKAPIVQSPDAVGPPPLLTFNPSLTLSTPELHAGDDFVATGTSFVHAPADTLTIDWDDFCSGQLDSSQVEWGIVPDEQSIPANPSSISIPRTWGDNKNTFTTPTWPPLPPFTTIAIRVRDLDVFSNVTTHWSPWLYLQTGAALANQVSLSLDDAVSTPLGTTNILPDGTLSQPLTMPISVQPGLYNVIVSQASSSSSSSSTPLASAGIRVIASGAPLTPMLQLFNSYGLLVEDSFTTNPQNVEVGQIMSLRGVHFTPAGPMVDVSTDIPGQRLGGRVPDGAGAFRLDFRVPSGFVGAHSIVASEGNLQASLNLLGNNPPA